MDINSLKKSNQTRWDNMKINSSMSPLDKVAKRLIAAKNRYLVVSAKTGVPWFIIAVIHEREASQDWGANLAQGDPWNKVSTHIPRGQGPFKSWEDAAINAIHSDHLDTWNDWTAGGALTALEKFNGLGYASKGRPSPYVWAKTDQYVSGKYIADGVYDNNAVDKQDGCAALIKRMQALDPSISFTSTSTKHVTTAGGVIVAGGAAAAASPTHWLPILITTAIVAAIAFTTLYFINKRKNK